MIRARTIIAALAITAALPSLAQENERKARLDEFAGPVDDAGVAVNQVNDGSRGILKNQPGDRAILSPPHSPPVPVASAQLSGLGEPSNPAQLSPLGDRNPQALPPLSQRSEGRPGTVVRLQGQDRCDPQDADYARREACRRIIELRAGEYSATEAPKLSVEQSLLAQQFRPDPRSLAGSTGQERQARPGTDPDEQMAQELAFLTAATDQPVEPSTEIPGDANLADAIRGVLVEMGVTGPR